MSLENPFQNQEQEPSLDSDAFAQAFSKTQEKYEQLDQASAQTFVLNILRRNQKSKLRGEQSYAQYNLNQALGQFNLQGEQQKTYRSLVSHYYASVRQQLQNPTADTPDVAPEDETVHYSNIDIVNTIRQRGGDPVD